MNSKNRTKAEQQWQSFIAEQGCFECGAPAQVHHCVGAAAKQRVGLERVKIGEYFCIPLCEYHHKEPHGIHGGLPHEHGITRKVYEKSVFSSWQTGTVECRSWLLRPSMNGYK